MTFISRFLAARCLSSGRKAWIGPGLAPSRSSIGSPLFEAEADSFRSSSLFAWTPDDDEVSFSLAPDDDEVVSLLFLAPDDDEA
jgi:hypothetical protein